MDPNSIFDDLRTLFLGVIGESAQLACFLGLLALLLIVICVGFTLLIVALEIDSVKPCNKH